MIIDIHTHVFPDALAPKALEVLTHNANVPPLTDGTCSGLLDSMRRSGVDMSCLMPIATRPNQSRSINQWVSEACGDREALIPFGSFHPAQENWREEIDFIVEVGLAGVKFHPDYQEFFVDEERMFPIYRALEEAGLIVLFHAGVDIGLPPPVHCPPDRLARVLDEVPNLTIIAAHMGGYFCWDDVERYLVGRNIYFDTSYSLADLGPERMTDLMKAHGTEKILFGTDSAWTDQADEVASIQSLSLSEAEIAAVLGENAFRLLGISKTLPSTEK